MAAWPSSEGFYVLADHPNHEILTVEDAQYPFDLAVGRRSVGICRRSLVVRLTALQLDTWREVHHLGQLPQHVLCEQQLPNCERRENQKPFRLNTRQIAESAVV